MQGGWCLFAAGMLLKIGIHRLSLVQWRIWSNLFQAENRSSRFILNHRCVSSLFEDILANKQVKKKTKKNCHLFSGTGKNIVDADGSRRHINANSLLFIRPIFAFANVGVFQEKQTNKKLSTIHNLNALNEAEILLYTHSLRHTQWGPVGFPGVIFINHIPTGLDLKSRADSKIHFDFHSGAG